VRLAALDLMEISGGSGGFWDGSWDSVFHLNLRVSNLMLKCHQESGIGVTQMCVMCVSWASHFQEVTPKKTDILTGLAVISARA